MGTKSIGYLSLKTSKIQPQWTLVTLIGRSSTISTSNGQSSSLGARHMGSWTYPWSVLLNTWSKLLDHQKLGDHSGGKKISNWERERDKMSELWRCVVYFSDFPIYRSFWSVYCIVSHVLYARLHQGAATCLPCIVPHQPYPDGSRH